MPTSLGSGRPCNGGVTQEQAVLVSRGCLVCATGRAQPPSSNLCDPNWFLNAYLHLQPLKPLVIAEKDPPNILS